jgi:uncharacterized protein (DUF2141 family)
VRKRFAIVDLAFVVARAHAAGTEQTVRVAGIQHERGEIGCALFERAPGFPMDTRGAQRLQYRARGPHVDCDFNDVPPCRYAVAVAEDLNGNQRVHAEPVRHRDLGLGRVEQCGAATSRTQARAGVLRAWRRAAARRHRARALTVGVRTSCWPVHCRTTSTTGTGFSVLMLQLLREEEDPWTCEAEGAHRAGLTWRSRLAAKSRVAACAQ